jgi:hypothetical protein
VANSIIGGLADGPFDQVQVWTEVLQDTFIRFFDSGKLSFATATSIRFSPEGCVFCSDFRLWGADWFLDVGSSISTRVGLSLFPISFSLC